ncbi:MAG: hypothetical protein ACFFCQ_08560 [Promethearchaeota archaeon]
MNKLIVIYDRDDNQEDWEKDVPVLEKRLGMTFTGHHYAGYNRRVWLWFDTSKEVKRSMFKKLKFKIKRWLDKLAKAAEKNPPKCGGCCK